MFLLLQATMERVYCINIVCITRESQLLGLMLLGLRKILAVYRHDSVLNRIGNKILTIYVKDVTIRQIRDFFNKN